MTALASLRAVYDVLPSAARLRDHLPDAATVETSIGRVNVERSALLALDLDDLYSARWSGDAVSDAVRRAVADAVRDAAHDAASIDVTVSLGHRGRVRLVAVETDEGVTIRAPGDSLAPCPTAST